MVGATQLPNSSCTSSIDEAQTPLRQCAEPRPARDTVKGTVRRAAQRLGIAFSRVRDVSYRNAEEMDWVKRQATNIELAHAMAKIEVLKDSMLAARTPDSLEVVAGLDAALRALGRGVMP
jgi:biotin synthase-related radical SAM superfamily protein